MLQKNWIELIKPQKMKVDLENLPQPYVFAFSVLTPQANRAYELAGMLKKKYPDCIIIMGNIHVNSMPIEALNNGADIVIRGEAETSLALHLDEHLVNMQHAKSEEGLNKYNSSYQWVDLWAAGPVNTISWTSTFTDSGICGEADKATKEKGNLIFEEAVSNLIGWSDEFFSNPKPKRVDHHLVKPDFNVPG